MDLDGIRLLMRVVELGSVQRAAHQLGIPRSSLRRTLDNLDAAIGTPLSVSSSTGVELTPAGAVVVEEGRALLAQYERIVSSAKSASGQTSGRVRVVVMLGMPEVSRLGFLRMLHAVTAGLCIDEIEHAEPLDHLHEPFDLMLHLGEPPTRGEWFSRLMLRLRLTPLASQAYLDRYGRPSSAAELAKHRLISWCGSGLDPRAWPLRAGGVLPVEPMFTSANGQLVHRAAQEGLGIALGNPDPTILPLSTPLVPLLADEVGCELSFRCLSPIPTDVDPRTRVVLTAIQNVITQMAIGR